MSLKLKIRSFLLNLLFSEGFANLRRRITEMGRNHENVLGIDDTFGSLSQRLEQSRPFPDRKQITFV